MAPGRRWAFPSRPRLCSPPMARRMRRSGRCGWAASSPISAMPALVLVELPQLTERDDAELVEALLARADYLAAERQHPILDSIDSAVERLTFVNTGLTPDFARSLAKRITRQTAGGISWSWDPLTGVDAILDAVMLRANVLRHLLRRVKAPILLIDGDAGPNRSRQSHRRTDKSCRNDSRESEFECYGVLAAA